MTGFTGEVLSHVVRRGLAETNISHGHPQSGTFHVNGFAVGAIMALFVLTIVMLFSIQYTIGSLMAKLAMIESSTTTTIIESHPPAYTEEPDAPLEKKPLIDEADIEIVTIKHKAITTSVKATINHVQMVGGRGGRWRGLRQSIVYEILTSFVSQAVTHLLLWNGSAMPNAKALGLTVATFLLCRFRMVWTHAMIAAPTNKPWYRRYCLRKDARVLLLPTMVYILTIYAAVLAPIATVYGLGVFDYADPSVFYAMQASDMAVGVSLALAGLVVFFLALIFLTIPANAALTRIEACLLPADEQTIVSFDRESIVGDLDLSVKGAPGKLFKAAWKSVTFSTRMRVLSIYATMVSFQITVVFINALLGVGILYIAAPDQLAMLAYVPI